jgi:hypothetical protein
MAVPITGWTFEDICIAVYGSYSPSHNSLAVFNDANSAFFNPTYNVLVDGKTNLAQFRDYGPHNAPVFTYSLTVSWVQMGPSGQLQFSYSITNVSSSTKTFYLKGDCNNGSSSTSTASHTLAPGQGTGSMIAITLGSQPSNWRFYIKEGSSSFTSGDIVETS